MIYILCVASCLLLYFCYRHKRSLKAYGCDNSFRYILTANAFDFLLPMSVVTLFYAVLSFVFTGSESDQTTLETLRNYERSLSWLKSKFGIFKLSAAYSLLLIVGLFLVTLLARYSALLRSQTKRIEKAYEHFETYSKWHKRISVLISLLASFTFLGGQVYTRAEGVQARIKFLEDKYDGYREELKDAIAETVTYQAHERLSELLTTNSPRLIEIDTRFSNYHEQVKVRYSRDTATYKVKSRMIEAINERVSKQSSKLHDQVQKITAEQKPPHTTSSPSSEHAKHLTNQKIETLRGSTKQYSERMAKYFEPLLRTPLGKRITPATLKLIITHKNSAALTSLVDQVPLLEPILSTFTATINKKLEAEINRVGNRVLDETIKEPVISLDSEIGSAAKEVLKEADIQWHPTFDLSLARQETALQEEFEQLDMAAKEFQILLDRTKTALRIENLQLEKELRAKWKTKVQLPADVIAEMQLRRRFDLAQPARLGQAEIAIDEFIAETRRLDEPTAHEVLVSAKKIVESSASVESKVSALKTIAENKFAGTTAAAALRSVESSVKRPAAILRPPSEFPFTPRPIRPHVEIRPPKPTVPWYRRFPRR